MNNLMVAEWEQWRDVCAQLKATRLVTETDLQAPMNSDATPGQRLLSSIRFWGDLRAQQGKLVSQQ